MPRKHKRPKKKSIKAKRKFGELKYVAVANKGYGNKLKGVRIYYEGSRPKGLRPDGAINLGKNILEILTKKFDKKFRWVITEDTDAIEVKYSIARVRTSQRLLRKMGSEQIDRNRDIKNDIINRKFAHVYPSHFTAPVTSVYAPGTLASTLSPDIVSKLSSDDRDALTRFLPEFVASESVGSVNLLKAKAQIQSLRELATELDAAIKAPAP